MWDRLHVDSYAQLKLETCNILRGKPEGKEPLERRSFNGKVTL
jgi:hypothetical protein